VIKEVGIILDNYLLLLFNKELRTAPHFIQLEKSLKRKFDGRNLGSGGCL